MYKKIVLALVLMSAITVAVTIFSIHFGKQIIEKNRDYKYDLHSYYSSVNLEDYLSGEKIVDQADYIIKCKSTGNREQYGKNILLEVEVEDIYKGDIKSKRNIKIVEPTDGYLFYNNYIPISNNKSYIFFLNTISDFSFESYKFTSTIVPFITMDNERYKKESHETVKLKELIDFYDYFKQNQQQVDEVKELFFKKYHSLK